MMAVARDEKGQTVWYGEKSLRPFQAWVVSIGTVSVNQELSLVVSSNKPLVGERHLVYDTRSYKGVTIGQFGQVLD
jgi:hypothetical protein